jgi:hypothetical protein
VLKTVTTALFAPASDVSTVVPTSPCSAAYVTITKELHVDEAALLA